MKFREILKTLIKYVQKVVLVFLLFLLYFFGFALTYLFALVFNRQMLGMGKHSAETYWCESEGYEPELDDALRQS